MWFGTLETKNEGKFSLLLNEMKVDKFFIPLENENISFFPSEIALNTFIEAEKKIANSYLMGALVQYNAIT